MPRSTGAKAKVEKAAIELFAARGVDGVSIGDIAAAAGVSQGALYRHYASKEDLAWLLFSVAYLRMGGELDAIRGRHSDLGTRLAAMVAHVCALYDDDPALFRFMLLAQHGLLPRVPPERRTPVHAVADAIADAVQTGEIAAVNPVAAAAAIMGIVLQTALFHVYGRLTGPLSLRAPALAGAALAAVAALGSGKPLSRTAGEGGARRGATGG
jgi:AcrR family transcriptional regulator